MTSAKYPKFILSKKQDGRFYWTFYANNKTPLLKSIRGYSTKQKALQSIMSVLKYGVDFNRYYFDTVNKAKNGFIFFLQGHKQVKHDGTMSHIAQSANPNYYTAASWQNAEQNVTNAIAATIHQIQKAKSKKTGCVDDMVHDKRKK